MRDVERLRLVVTKAREASRLLRETYELMPIGCLDCWIEFSRPLRSIEATTEFIEERVLHEEEIKNLP